MRKREIELKINEGQLIFPLKSNHSPAKEWVQDSNTKNKEWVDSKIPNGKVIDWVKFSVHSK